MGRPLFRFVPCFDASSSSSLAHPSISATLARSLSSSGSQTVVILPPARPSERPRPEVIYFIFTAALDQVKATEAD